MILAPEKLFVNVYSADVGKAVGTAYRTRVDADAAATSKRVACLELGVDAPQPTSAIVLSDLNHKRLLAHAERRKISIEAALFESLNTYFAIHQEVLDQAKKYAADKGTTLPAVIAEAARAYFVEAG